MVQDVRKILAANIERLRNENGLTRENLAVALEFDNSYISKLEKGKINITIDRLIKIADFFDIEIHKLLQ